MIKGSFEARKIAYRQTKDGVVVSFVIHPNDQHAELATAPLGIRMMIGYAEIGDDETTAISRKEVVPDKSVPEPDNATPPATLEASRGLHSEKDADRSEKAKAQYASKSDMEKAVVRASLLCNDPQFIKWFGKRFPHALQGETDTANALRYALNVKSRSEIGSSNEAYQRFLTLEARYKQTTGQLAEVRG